MNLQSHRFSQNTNKKFLPSLHRAEILTIFVRILGETMTSLIHSEIVWPLSSLATQCSQIFKLLPLFWWFCFAFSFLFPIFPKWPIFVQMSYFENLDFPDFSDLLLRPTLTIWTFHNFNEESNAKFEHIFKKAFASLFPSLRISI